MRKKLTIPLLLAALAGAVALVPHTASADTTTPVTYTYAGDSITARPDSWLHQLSDGALQNVGGFAESGYTTAQVLARVTPHPSADVLVLEVGTNDVNMKVGSATMLRNIGAIAAKVGATHVLLLATPPDNLTNDPRTHVNRQRGQSQLNTLLTTYAAQHGWLYADPFSAIRQGTGAYTGGSAASDNVHPTAAANAKVTVQMDLYIKQAATLTH